MPFVFKPHVDPVELQVMGDAMALAAAAHLLDDRLRVRFWMAFLADRDGAVAGGMAGGAQDVTVLGPAVRQQGVDRMMAGAAILRRRLGCEGDFERHVGFVALVAGGVGHALQVRLVAVETGWQIAMLGVTGRTVEGGMD